MLNSIYQHNVVFTTSQKIKMKFHILLMFVFINPLDQFHHYHHTYHQQQQPHQPNDFCNLGWGGLPDAEATEFPPQCFISDSHEQFLHNHTRPLFEIVQRVFALMSSPTSIFYGALHIHLAQAFVSGNVDETPFFPVWQRREEVPGVSQILKTFLHKLIRAIYKIFAGYGLFFLKLFFFYFLNK